MEVQCSDGCSACGQGGASCTPPGTGSANTEVHRKHPVCRGSPPSRVGIHAHGAIKVVWEVREQGVCWAAPYSLRQCTRLTSYGSCMLLLRLHFCTPLYANMLEILEILIVTLTVVCGGQDHLDCKCFVSEKSDGNVVFTSSLTVWSGVVPSLMLMPPAISATLRPRTTTTRQ